MTCPECGFVTFPGLTRCKKCGHAFSPEPPGQARSSAGQDEPDAGRRSSLGEPQDEASARVARFRRRRGAQHDEDGEGSNLELDFEPDFDAVLHQRESAPPIDSLELKDPAPGRGVIAASVASPEAPLEFSEGASDADTDVGATGVEVARLGPRVVAGVIDLALLLAAVVLFASIFWWTGGRIHPRAANLAVVAVILALLALAYVGLFNALALHTLGEALAGLDVRSLDGSLPSLAQRSWRSFGYLVSAAALMLGFIWAAVDSDGLTWHDRMSDTCLVEARSPGD